SVDFDWQRIRRERGHNSTFAGSPRGDAYPVVASGARRCLSNTLRSYPKHPFVPDDEQEFDARARDVLAIQATGLARRLRAAGSTNPVIGLSGGLDSTLAFLVCLDALALNGLGLDSLRAITMPGPGTSEHTNASAKQLAEAAGATIREIPIDGAVRAHLDDIGHNGTYDVTFENVQARERTQILFDVANQTRGVVVGTGDLSELALGWCTFNADHMAHYNVNASVPKSMVAYLVRWYGRHRAGAALAAVLERVLDTPITPELVPSESGALTQRTESIIGPYELHDFFLYHYIRTGAAPGKIYALAKLAFGEDYSGDEIRRWLKVFFRRFFEAQFKRTTLPAGPKVGTVSLSPRGDWRMPDEADANAALRSLEKLE
ncbi:MAG: NAD(+) synthase, partial [Gammaproteobacteria bacterium]|nr:NAD(+) synthase [Gammaproteobacteria bacterium]